MDALEKGDPLLEGIQLSKSFSGALGVQGVNVTLEKGEIHALVGANGAGKSTLMKLLSGAYGIDEGEIRINGQRVHIANPADAKRHGIHCVYQEVDTVLAPTLTVAENLFLEKMAGGFQSKGKNLVFWKTLYRETEEVMNRMGFLVSPKKKVNELTLAEKQMVLLARGLVQQAKVILFDEPTAPLSPEESNHLFSCIRQLKIQGVGIFFISHRMPEVFAICDRISVLRDGQLLWSKPTGETSPEDVIETMLGKKRKPLSQENREIGLGNGFIPTESPLLEVKNLSDGEKVLDASFEVGKGEIVGIAGLVGAGKTELARLLFGADPRKQGKVLFRQQPVHFPSPREAIAQGWVLIPEERREQGLFIEESIQTNLSLPLLKRLSPFGWIQRGKERILAKDLITRLSIKANSLETTVDDLSGGNQQKVVIGKWLETDAHVYLLDEPTKGIDIGAKDELFALLKQLVGQGKGLLYFSSEMEELAAIADTIYILYKGRIIKKLKKNEAAPDTILYYASGGGLGDDAETKATSEATSS